MQMEHCIFCELKNNTNKIIYKDKHCYVVLDKYPIEEGHMLVISNEHYGSMIEAPDPVVEDMAVVSKKFAMLLEQRLGATAVNIGSNIGEDAGQKVMHFHIHLIPRYHGGRRSFNFGHNIEMSDEKEYELIKKLK